MKKKIADFLLTVIPLVILAWIIVSYAEIMQYHNTPNYNYTEWNFFKVFFPY